MTNKEAIKYLKQLYPNGGHCWLDDQRMEAIGMAVKALQEEPVSGLDNGNMPIERWEQAVKAASNQRSYRSSKGLTETRDDYFVDGVQWADEHPKEEPASEDKMTISKEWFDHCKKSWYNEGYIDGEYNRDRQFEESVSEDLEKIVEEIAEPTILNAYGTKELARRLRNTICGTSVSEGLGEYINKLSKQFPEVSFAKLSRIAVRVAKWQKQQDQSTIELAEDHAMLAGMEKMKEQMMANIWKSADGDDLPEIDREVIALLDNGKVVFAHRPPEFWDGKDIVTGKVTRNYPKTYDKGGWNIPNVVLWLDLDIPKIEKD